jgi:hypothetical protein
VRFGEHSRRRYASAQSLALKASDNCSEVVLYPAATGRHTSLEGSEVWYTL